MSVIRVKRFSVKNDHWEHPLLHGNPLLLHHLLKSRRLPLEHKSLLEEAKSRRQAASTALTISQMALTIKRRVIGTTLIPRNFEYPFKADFVCTVRLDSYSSATQSKTEFPHRENGFTQSLLTHFRSLRRSLRKFVFRKI